jgi:hypothetical protein
MLDFIVPFFAWLKRVNVASALDVKKQSLPLQIMKCLPLVHLTENAVKSVKKSLAHRNERMPWYSLN